MNLRQRSTVRRLVTPVAVATVLAAMLPALAAESALAADGGIHINFQPAGTAPAGYIADTGVAFNGTSGWTDTTGAPIDMTKNTRIRNSALSPDKRYDTYLIMQLAANSTGNATPGRYVATLPNGLYDVTVGVGDPTAINSVDEITAQPGTADATTIIDHFVPTATNQWSTVTKRVNVSGGQLVLDPTGGTQTKLDFVDAVPAAADTTAPVVTSTLTGTLASGTTYNSAVTVTSSATDNVAVTGISYTLDGGASTPYTAPVKVSTVGDHTVVVTAVDAAGNAGTATSTFTVASLLPTSVHVNFQPAGTVPAGYTADTGVAFNGTSGWTDVNGNPLDMTANSRIRNSAASPDKRYDTLIVMQGLSGQLTPGRWTTPLNNGQYDVTVAVGDATAVNSVYEITAQPGSANATTIVDHYTPTTAAPFDTVTKRVTVTNGTLTLDPTGGTQTKIDFVDAVPAVADTTAPVVTTSLAGPNTTGTTYNGPVTVTATATDNVGVSTETYTLDGGAATPYTAPVVVSALGSHSLVVTATDTAGNSGTSTAAFTIVVNIPTSFHVNFGAQTTKAFPGYTLDYGVAYTSAAGSGWENPIDSSPLSLVGNGRERNLAASPDKRYDTMIQMQQAASSTTGTTTPGQWEHLLANGDYLVTVAVGDASAINSLDRINVESGTPNAQVLINNFVPTSGNFFDTVTQRVTVSDGALTIDATGGSNTKIDFIDVVAATADTTPPTASIALTGALASPGVYGGNVTATVTASDEAGGSGLASVTYSLDGGASTTYSSPIKVTALGSHTLSVTATDHTGNIGTATSAWTQQTATTASLLVTSLDQTSLALAAPRLVFSAVRGYTQAPVRYFTFANTGAATLTVTGLKITGNNPESFSLASGQASSLSIPAGTSVQVGVSYHPSEPTGCPTTAAPDAIGNINRDATLVYTTNDPVNPTGSNAVAGVYACYSGGNAEPVLDQIVQALGYSTIIDTPGGDRRYQPKARYAPFTDEVQSPYFTLADPSQPASMTMLAHYSGPSSRLNEPSGWFAQGATLAKGFQCNASCNQLSIFPIDPSKTNLGESEKLLPVGNGTVNGTSTFAPTGVFGIYGGNTGDVSFSDDGFNTSTTTPVIYEHSIRVYQAYDANRVIIPNTYIVADDPGRNAAGKNNDYQDIVMLLRNVMPAVAQGPLAGAATTTDLTKGGTVSASCAITGFDGVLANTAGTQCNAAGAAFSSAGLALTSTAGVLTSNNQQNALYKNFDATRGQFTIDATVAGPLPSLTSGNQQIGAFFGPDQNNFIKVQADAVSGAPHITMTYREKGVATTATVAVPGLTTTSTLDLVIIGNTSVPDPATGKLAGFPLDQLSVYYKIDGGALTSIGTVKTPADVVTWFSRMAKAGVLVSNAGSATPITATFSKFSIVPSTGAPTSVPAPQPIGAIVSALSSSLCVDVTGNTSANGTAIEIYTCNNGANQSWTVAGGTIQSLGKCMDVNGGGTANGTKVQLYDCNGTTAQAWTPQANGTLLNPGSGKCLDDPASSTTIGTKLQIYTCSGNANQQWYVPS
ncbi:hypothetical protein acdb102_36350 [Acidothermaceae bacterium B102]|nr:hypothetical protein acdb102_36350 [Acidothermaceae bacterium B102]